MKHLYFYALPCPLRRPYFKKIPAVYTLFPALAKDMATNGRFLLLARCFTARNML